MTPRGHVLPVVGGHPRRPRAAAPRGPARLPWWAVALPAVAFTVLLAVVLRAGHPASADSAQPLIALAGRLRDLLIRALGALA